MKEEYVGFWPRFLALIIDAIVLSIVLMPLYFIFVWQSFKAVMGPAYQFVKTLGTSQTTFSPEQFSQIQTTAAGFTLKTQLFNLLALIIDWLYSVVLIGRYGATLGKMALKLKVVGKNFEKIGYGKAALREIVGKIVSSLVFCLGYLWVAWDAKKQGFHDKIAGTYVIKKS